MMLNYNTNIMRASTRSIGNRNAVVVRAAPATALSRHELEQKRRAEAKARQDAEDEARRRRLVAANMANSSPFTPARDSQLATVSEASRATQVWSAPTSSAQATGDKDLALKIASLEKQIRDANSDARKAPLIAQLNALRSGSASSYSAPVSRPSSAPASTFKAPAASYSAPATGDKDLANKIASLEKQIRDANSDARKAPLIAQLNALRSGSAPAPTPIRAASPAPSYSAPAAAYKAPAASYSAPATGDKDLANKIASLEKQIRDANSDARKAPLIAQLNALRSGSASSYSAPSSRPSSAPAAFSPPPSTSNLIEAKAEVKAWSTVEETARQYKLAAEQRVRQMS